MADSGKASDVDAISTNASKPSRETVPQYDAREYILDMSEELATLAAKSGLAELESILRLAKLAARQPADG